MSKPRQKFNLENLCNIINSTYKCNLTQNFMLKRLFCVTLYDYIENYCTVVKENTTQIINVIRSIIPDINYNIDHIINWLVDPANLATEYEKAIAYNLMEVPAKYIRNKLRTPNTNIYTWNKATKLVLRILPTETLIILLNSLMKIENIIYDLSIFKEAICR